MLKIVETKNKIELKRQERGFRGLTSPMAEFYIYITQYIMPSSYVSLLSNPSSKLILAESLSFFCHAAPKPISYLNIYNNQLHILFFNLALILSSSLWYFSCQNINSWGQKPLILYSIIKRKCILTALLRKINIINSLTEYKYLYFSPLLFWDKK